MRITSLKYALRLFFIKILRLILTLGFNSLHLYI